MLGLLRDPTFLLSLALILPLAACAGDDSGTSATTSASTSTSATESTSATASTSGTSGTTGTATSTTDSGTGTATGTSGTTGGLEPECVVDADCQLVDNCCECSSLPADDEPEACDFDCLVSECTSQGLEGLAATCRSGICELSSALNCDGPVACDQEPPACAGDEVPSVVGECWGPCAPLHYCADSSACAPGCGDGWVCVDSQSGGNSGCAPLPAACAGVASCGCFAPFWDEVCPGSCSESGGGLLCEDGG